MQWLDLGCRRFLNKKKNEFNPDVQTGAENSTNKAQAGEKTKQTQTTNKQYEEDKRADEKTT
ncbi:hypothetical protein GQX39_13105, partial [Staphylococcus aureus]|nr:hypothetical protein [Staphylococcus aureus]